MPSLHQTSLTEHRARRKSTANKLTDWLFKSLKDQTCTDTHTVLGPQTLADEHKHKAGKKCDNSSHFQPRGETINTFFKHLS